MKHCVDDTASFAVFMTYSLKKAGKLISKVSGAWLTPAQPLYWSIPTPDGLEFAVLDGNWKLLLNSEGAPVYLFDLRSDPYEILNQLTQRPDMVARLQRSFEQIHTSVLRDMANWTHDATANQNAQ